MERTRYLPRSCFQSMMGLSFSTQLSATASDGKLQSTMANFTMDLETGASGCFASCPSELFALSLFLATVTLVRHSR